MTFSGAAVARWIAPFLTVAAVAAVGAVSAPVHSADTPAVRLASDANPLAGMPFYVNPQSKGMRAAQGNPDPLLAAVVNTPTAYWMDHISTPAVDAKYIATAQAAGTMPILALYGIPNRDCGSYAAGGFGSAGSYRAWIDGVAAAAVAAPGVAAACVFAAPRAPGDDRRATGRGAPQVGLAPGRRTQGGRRFRQRGPRRRRAEEAVAPRQRGSSERCRESGRALAAPRDGVAAADDVAAAGVAPTYVFAAAAARGDHRRATCGGAPEVYGETPSGAQGGRGVCQRGARRSAEASAATR